MSNNHQHTPGYGTVSIVGWPKFQTLKWDRALILGEMKAKVPYRRHRDNCKTAHAQSALFLPEETYHSLRRRLVALLMVY